MKSLGIILLALAVAAGIVVGKLDHEATLKERAERIRGSSGGEDPLPARQAPPRPATAREEPTTAVASGARSEREEPRGAAPAADAVPPAAGDSSLSPVKDASEFRERLGRVETLLRAGDTEAAGAEAERIRAETVRGPLSVHDRAAVLAAKARVYARVLGSVERQTGATPAPVAPPPASKAAQVRLANGNTFTAVNYREEQDRWVFQLEGGGNFAPLKEDVLEVREGAAPTGGAPSAGGAWETLERKLSKVDDTILLYVDGVERCLRQGMVKEALTVLERVLARSDSEKIPLLFLPSTDDAALEEWRLAAGRGTPGASPPQDVATSNRGGPGDTTGESPRRPRIFDPGETRREPVGAGEGTGAHALAEASALFRDAQKLYQGAARQEGKAADLEAARNKLHEALGLLEVLPDQDEVRKLRRQVAQLLSDVSRVSPF